MPAPGKAREEGVGSCAQRHTGELIFYAMSYFPMQQLRDRYPASALDSG